ncbi:MAG: hypothetical protein M0R51_11120 [Clostridia bacterium]|jgi:hypothetical protein|nr:hypothetical protein [Clostridia bacterium]
MIGDTIAAGLTVAVVGGLGMVALNEMGKTTRAVINQSNRSKKSKSHGRNRRSKSYNSLIWG